MTKRGTRYEEVDYTPKEIRYRVLAKDKINSTDKAVINSMMASVVTGEQAKQYAVGNPLWTCKVLDMLGNVVRLDFKNLWVCVFVKRQVFEVEIQSMDPIPPNVMQDPQDVWTRIDLLGASARQVNLRLIAKQHDQATDMSLLKQKNIILVQENEEKDKEIKRLKEELGEVNIPESE